MIRKINHLQILILAAAALMTSCSPDTGKAPSGIAHVIVIGVDGLSPDGIRKADTPVMDSLIGAGAVKWKVRTVLTSASSQNWASMLMGSGPEAHGIINNDWEIDSHSLPPLIQEKDGRFPTIFSLVKSQHRDAEIGSVYHWKGFGRLYQKDAVTFDRSLSTEDSTAREFAAYIREKKPLLGFVHFDHVDHAGHHDGHGTKAYYESVSKADSLVGIVADAIRSAGIADKTLIMLVSDHGGIGYGHGGATPEEAETALIMSGAGIRKGYEVQQTVYVYDYAATIAFALGLTPPYTWTGRPVKAAFEGFEEPSNNWKGPQQIAAPVIHPEKELYKKAGGLYIDKEAEVSITPVAKDSETRYTLDGSDPVPASELYAGPVKLSATTVVKARAFDKEGNESPVSVAYFRLLKSGPGKGVRVTFYPLAGGQKLPLFSNLKKGPSWTEPEIGTDHERILPLLGGKAGSFALTAEGFIQIDAEGKYTFYTQSDDGSKLYIDGKQVVDNDGAHGVVEKSGSVTLQPGRHPIRVEYFNNVGSGWLEAYYKGPGIAKQLIPADKLFLAK